MAVDLSKTLIVAVTATALFDLTDQDREFREAEAQNKEGAIVAYRKSMVERENDPLEMGVAFPLVKALLKLNAHQSDGEPPLVEVIVLSRNSPETGLRVLHSIDHHHLAITRSAFRGGQSVVPLLRAFRVDLFLTSSESDAQIATDAESCAVGLIKGKLPATTTDGDDPLIRIAFDGDAVLFGEESEAIFKSEGLSVFYKHEQANEETPLPSGPHAALLKKLFKLQERLPTRVEYSPLRIILVTARNAPAHIRPIKTLRSWGVYIDEALFLGGLPKAPFLEALNPHIFFDDQDVHVDGARIVVPSAKVPYRSNSPLLLPSSESKPQIINTSVSVDIVGDRENET